MNFLVVKSSNLKKYSSLMIMASRLFTCIPIPFSPFYSSSSLSKPNLIFNLRDTISFQRAPYRFSIQNVSSPKAFMSNVAEQQETTSTKAYGSEQIQVTNRAFFLKY
ncbi:hypothetical protein LIER_42726 [Lithospermum erythrorhizon]|uniref:Uncharacterized protein n=1 Tax=Lithospermum erythrorhizon TaxID=34254 RepID=A0AAV3NSW5_LITER